MFTIEDVLSEENQRAALADLRGRHDSVGPDGMHLAELDAWHKANGSRLLDSILEGDYRPGIARCYEVVTSSGKRREVVSVNAIDRFVEKMLQLELCRLLNPLFSPNSLAYQEGKGPLDAAMIARGHIESGHAYVCEIDLKDYFTTVDLEALLALAGERVSDEPVLQLLRLFLYRDLERDGRLTKQRRGLLQGASTSPVLSNLYLDAYDHHMDRHEYRWFRFSDNICVYEPTLDTASESFRVLCDLLESEHGVLVNRHKSGIHRAIGRRVLGYDLVEVNGTIEVRRHTYQLVRRHEHWHASSIYRDHDAYHILQDGVINRKDYSLLFENEDERHHIPVEVTSQINVYSNVTISPSALSTLCKHDIRVAYVDRYGDLLGTFVPARHVGAAETFLQQCKLYTSPARRLSVARLLEEASIHNMRANLRYYAKRGRDGMDEHVDYLTSCLEELGGRDGRQRPAARRGPRPPSLLLRLCRDPCRHRL